MTVSAEIYIYIYILKANLCLLLNITTLTSQVYFYRQSYSMKTRGNWFPCVIKIDGIFIIDLHGIENYRKRRFSFPTILQVCIIMVLVVFI